MNAGESLPVAAVAGDTAGDAARRPLIAVSVLAFLVTVTGTFTYAYPTTLAALQEPMLLVHEIGGDLLVLALVVYLAVHLKRVWRMWRRVLSRWSGYVAVAAWGVVGVSGVIWQLVDEHTESLLGAIHVVSGIAGIALGCFHGGYGLRRYFTSASK